MVMVKFFLSLLFVTCFFTNSNSFALTQQQARGFFHIDKNDRLIFIDIKGFQQTTDYTCCPAIAMSLQRYYKMINPGEMTAATEQRIAKEMGTTSEEGTDELQLVNWLRHHDFQVRWGYDGSLSLIKKYVARGVPVLVDWIDWGGHWVAVAGLDQSLKPVKHQTLYFADPAAHFDNILTKDGITFIDADRFETMWFNSKLKRHIYIVAVPANQKSLLY